MIRKEQQRFSLRKYKVGVASVFLGTTLSFMLANGGAVKASELPTQPSSEEKTELVKKDSSSEDSSKKEESVVENVVTTELVDTNKVEEVKPTIAEAGISLEEHAKLLETEKAEEAKRAVTEVTPPTPPTPEKPKGRELPNTGEQSTVGVVALGAALGLVGLGLVAKPKRRED